MTALTTRPDSAPTAPATTPATDPATDPVFVDPTGRRLARGRQIGLLVIALMAAYVALMLLAFLGGTTVDAPDLPAADPAHAGAHPAPPARTNHQ